MSRCKNINRLCVELVRKTGSFVAGRVLETRSKETKIKSITMVLLDWLSWVLSWTGLRGLVVLCIRVGFSFKIIRLSSLLVKIVDYQNQSQLKDSLFACIWIGS